MVDDSVQIKFLITQPATPALSGVYTGDQRRRPQFFRVTSPLPSPTARKAAAAWSPIPLKASQWNRSGTVTVDPSTWNIGSTESNLNQTPLNSTTVFNFFYPDYQYPGDMAQAGMTTPEFQLTNDSNTMNLTNAITQGTLTNNTGNTNGYMSFFEQQRRDHGSRPLHDAGPDQQRRRSPRWWTRSACCSPAAT